MSWRRFEMFQYRDDFGLKPLRPPADEDFRALIAERYELTTTIVTSNRDFEEWGDTFPANRYSPPRPSTGSVITPTAWSSKGNPTGIPRWRGRCTNPPLQSAVNWIIFRPFGMLVLAHFSWRHSAGR